MAKMRSLSYFVYQSGFIYAIWALFDGEISIKNDRKIIWNIKVQIRCKNQKQTFIFINYMGTLSYFSAFFIKHVLLNFQTFLCCKGPSIQYVRNFWGFLTPPPPGMQNDIIVTMNWPLLHTQRAKSPGQPIGLGPACSRIDSEAMKFT